MKPRLIRLRWLPVLVALALLVGCASHPSVVVEPWPQFDALFARNDGWTGADGAYSVELSDGLILWLFGDTWIGKIRDGRHVDSVLVNNSIALQTGTDPADARVEFFWGITPEGKPAAFFRPADGKGWLWPYQGYLASNGLYLFLVQLEPDSNPAGLGFKVTATWLAHIGNPRDPPAAWHIAQKRIPFGSYSGSGDTLFGSATLKDGAFVYVYGVRDMVQDGFRNKNMLVARVAEDRLGDFDQWRFYAGGQWKGNFSQAGRLCEHMANEFSVSFLAGQNTYVGVYTPDGFGRKIAARTAPTPYGPWRQPLELYRCPEASWAPDIFCYAAKAHPCLSRKPNELIVTYVANSTNFDRVANDARLYRPRFLRVVFKP
jgi:Domain of unknown function (DUF4185)